MGRTCTLETLDAAIAEILDEYGDSVVKASHECVKKTVKAGARAINQAAGGAVGGNKYKSSWTSKTDNGRLTASGTIYSDMPGLPHLLEHGHLNRRGGRVVKGPTPAHPHIAGAVEQINSKFPRDMIRAINSAKFGV